MKTFTTFGVFVLAIVSSARFVQAADLKAADQNVAPADSAIEFFQAIDDHQIDVKFLAKSDHDARILIKNTTKQPLNLKLPAAFAGVPALAQFGRGGGGGGARGGGFGGGGRGGGTTGGGGQQQSVGGGLGGGGGGGLGGGGGGGIFSIPPEETAKIDVPVVCLNHGLRAPNASAAYKIVPADEFLEDRPAVVELLKAYGRGELQHGGAQAAAWHLNSDRTWDQLRAQLTGTRRSFNRAPYFNGEEIRAAMGYANEATRLAEENADEYARAKKARAEKLAKAKSEASHARSAGDDNANNPAAADKVDGTSGSAESTNQKS
jgi:hypothetical protein